MTASTPPVAVEPSYDDFVASARVQLRRALVARYGVEVGLEVTSDALAYAWEHWSTVSGMANPVGYLYRVAQSSARRHRRWSRPPVFPPEDGRAMGDPEPGLSGALARLPEAHRVAVLLVHAHGCSYEEAAGILGVPVTTLRNHLHRGMTKLRQHLGVTDDD